MEYMECDFESDNLHKTDINQFVSLTNTSEDFANDYLTSYDWNLPVAVNNFFESSVGDIEIDYDKTFTVLSWNVDGLDTRHIDIRTHSFLTVIKENSPDFVLLQELVSYSEQIMRATLANQYDFFIDSQHDSYYCGILVKRITEINLIRDLTIVKFPGSSMGRNLLSVTVNVHGIDLKLMTSHIESMKDFSEERKNQLTTAFNEMKTDSDYSIFAGDMNVRDFELRQIQSPPNNIVDVCEFLCTKANEMPTWEPSDNKNISSNLSMAPGMRFDRMYFYSSIPGGLKPVGFHLLGKNITECNLHASDHWAISGVFSL